MKFVETWFSASFPATYEWVMKNSHHAPAAALVFGFIWDSLTLGSPDRIFDNAVMLMYIVIAGGCIILVNARGHEAAIGRLPLIVVMQFAFGNLASALFVLYGKSGTLEGSAAFFILFGGFLIGNELLRKRYAQAQFHIAAYYLLVLSYCALVVPVLLEQIGARAFVISAFVSAVFITVFLFLIYTVTSKALAARLYSMAASAAGVLIAFSLMYVFNIIPPVPLALNHLGIYHSVNRQGDGYAVTFEKPHWFEFWRETDKDYTQITGEGASCFSVVFAPRNLTTPIFHNWEKYNEVTEEWVSQSRIEFPIRGGRDEGYRGYTTKTVLTPGKWRCSVETERGALLGREVFRVNAGESVHLSETTL